MLIMKLSSNFEGSRVIMRTRSKGLPRRKMHSSFSVSKEKREAEGLRAELVMDQKEHAELSEQVRRIFEVRDDDSIMVIDGPNLQVQQKLDMIVQLRE